ncbi:MAG: hypothetical protein HS127_08850 [Planctomycetia bacterium]|uniref:hypothetical protein n=1 Tax=Candidatus Kuenenia sp. TaxID=2499824 RepID=UPI001D722C2B|nr:hypothetical protein [Planctomycetia bacterium]
MIDIVFYISLFINFCLICEYMRPSLIIQELQKELEKEKELGKMLVRELEKARAKKSEREKEKKYEDSISKINMRPVFRD